LPSPYYSFHQKTIITTLLILIFNNISKNKGLKVFENRNGASPKKLYILIEKVPVVLIEKYPVNGTKIQLILESSC